MDVSKFRVVQYKNRGQFPDYYEQELPFEIIKFPTGELLVRCEVMDGVRKVGIVVQDVTTDGLFVLAQLVDIFRSYNPRVSVSAIIPFFPNARQDRKNFDNESFSLKVYSNFLNLLRLDKVYVADPHSDVVMACVDNCVAYTQEDLFEHFIKEHKKDYSESLFIAPDVGAYKKTAKCAALVEGEVVTASKTRNPKTGTLTIECKHDCAGRDVVIIDDICDGGGTFIGLMNSIKENSSGPVKSSTLIVTHGIFSKGLKVFDGVFDEIVYYNGVNFDLNNSDATQVKVTHFPFIKKEQDGPKPFASH